MGAQHQSLPPPPNPPYDMVLCCSLTHVKGNGKMAREILTQKYISHETLLHDRLSIERNGTGLDICIILSWPTVLRFNVCVALCYAMYHEECTRCIWYSLTSYYSSFSNLNAMRFDSSLIKRALHEAYLSVDGLAKFVSRQTPIDAKKTATMTLR